MASCVDTITFPMQEAEKKLFVVCELRLGENIIADVSYVGSLAQEPTYLEQPDTFKFQLAIGEKDFSEQFDHVEGSQFVIPKSDLALEQGEKYKFVGIGLNDKRALPSVTMPKLVSVDTVIIHGIKVDSNLSVYTSYLDCTIKLKPNADKQAYYYMEPRTKQGLACTIESFNMDKNPFKRMAHRDGFLIDYSRMNDDEISVTLKVSEPMKTDEIYFYLSNVTESFYRYNFYLSNVATDPGQSSGQPAIASFNVNTNKAFGSFSARATTRHIKKIY